MSAVVDLNEYGQPVRDEHRRLGAGSVDKTDVGMYVRFEPGFGLNVHVGMRREVHDREALWKKSYVDREAMVLGIDGWEQLCCLVDDWRARKLSAGVEL